MRTVTVLGSTGSVGTQALEVIGASPERLRVFGLAAGGANPALIASQALAAGVQVIALARASAAEDVLLALYAEAQLQGYDRGNFPVPKILAGPEAATELAGIPVDVCLNAITGSIGLAPTLEALAVGSTVALANKESLISGGDLVLAARQRADQLVPVDSEHSAIAQCLRAGSAGEVARLLLTASGGPFRGCSREQMEGVDLAAAMAHPTWAMGPVITVNSATLANKGLELIEAHLLFGVPYERIEVVVHPQSLVHSMVEFLDGSTIAQLSPPDMRLPIALALDWPDRAPGLAPSFDWGMSRTLTFEPLDNDAFPAVTLARECGERGGLAPCAFNAANEVAVGAFVDGRLDFLGIIEIVARVVEEIQNEPATSLAAVLDMDSRARRRARELVEDH